MNCKTLGYIPRLLNALNGLVYFLIIGDLRGDSLMVESMFQTEEAECNLIGEMFNFPHKKCVGK